MGPIDQNNRGGISRVSVTRASRPDKKQIKEAFERLLGAFGGIRKIIPPDVKKVLIKPNLMMGEPWTTGITVNPFIVELLIMELKKERINVIVGEGAGWGCPSDDAFKATGITGLCSKLEVPLVDFKRGETVRLSVPDGSVLKYIVVDRVVPECDFIINVAKMKTHCETIASLSLKNMKGFIAEDKERLRFHLLDVNRCLVDLNRTIKADFSIVEGIIALEGIGPLFPGKPKPLGVLAGGKDPVAVDSVCARIMGMDPAEIRHIQYAYEAGLGKIDLDDIEVAGESIESVKPVSWELPPLTIEALSPFNEIRIVNGNPCSNCIASLASYLHGYIDKKIIEEATTNVEILIGKKAVSSGSGKEIAIGNCLERYRGKLPFVSGCPPPSDAYLELIALGLKGDFKPLTVNSDARIVDPENGESE
ncbi:MAG TPA: DUF362 domain-containing protein [Spirochaetes bacterium]|nr:DUF362 domain-containing protein [Spirochaetota bacterium]